MSDTPSSAPADSLPWRVAVVGGGLSGLAAAHRLGELCREHNRPLELTVFEAAGRVGGVIETRRLGDYLVETGADSFITNKPWGVALCRRLGIEDRLIPTDSAFRRSLVLRAGKPVPIPEGFALLSPARLRPVWSSPIFSPWGKLRMGLEYFIPRRRKNGDESLASFVRRRLGREALERLVQPLVGGIYTSDPEKLSLEATMPRFLEMERDYRSLIRAAKRQTPQQSPEEQTATGARYGLFATFNGGLAELIDALQQRVAEFATIRLNTAVSAIRLLSEAEGGGTSTGRWGLILHDRTTAEFDALLLSVPAYRAAELLTGVDPILARLLRDIEYASTVVVVTGHRSSDVRHPLEAFGLVVPAVERRKVLAVSFSSRKFPGRAPEGHVLLRTFVGGAMQPQLLGASDEGLVDLVRSELRDLLGVGGREDFALLTRYTRAMPQYHVGHVGRVEQIEAQTARHEGLALAGNAYRGVGLPDCIHSGEQAAERIFRQRSACNSMPTPML